MSTILKALRRLEEDKRARAALSLDEAVLEPAAASRRSSSGGLAVSLGAGAAAAIGVVAIAWSLSDLWMPRAQEPAPAAPVAALQTPPQESAPTVTVAIVDAPRPPATTPVPIAQPSPLKRTQAIEKRIAAGQKPASATTEAPAPAALTVVAKVPERPEAPAAVSAPAPTSVRRSVAKPASVPPPAPESVVAKSTPQPAPAPARVEVVERSPVPELAVQQILWHPTPSRRIAVFEVEGEGSHRIGEGQVVAGFTVAKIGISQVDLVRDGVELKRRVGSN
jgi:hypothetical protein